VTVVVAVLNPLGRSLTVIVCTIETLREHRLGGDQPIYRWKLGSGVKYNRKHPDTSGSQTRSNALPLSPASSSRGRWCAGSGGVRKDGRWNGRVSRCAEHPGSDN
jgi:hypothetical protein